MGLLITNMSRTGWRSHIFGIWAFLLRVQWPQHQGEKMPDSNTALCSLFSDVSNSDYVQH